MKKIMLFLVIISISILVGCKSDKNDRAFRKDLERINSYTINEFDDSLLEFAGPLLETSFSKLNFSDTKIAASGMGAFNLPNTDYFLYKNGTNIFLGYENDKIYLYKAGIKRLQLIYNIFMQSFKTRPSASLNMFLSMAKIDLSIEDIINSLYFEYNDFTKKDNLYLCKEEAIEVFLKRLAKNHNEMPIESFLDKYEQKIIIKYENGMLQNISLDIKIYNYIYQASIDIKGSTYDVSLITINNNNRIFEATLEIGDKVIINASYGDNLVLKANLEITKEQFLLMGDIPFNNAIAKGKVSYSENVINIDLKEENKTLAYALIIIEDLWIKNANIEIKPALIGLEGENISLSVSTNINVPNKIKDNNIEPGDLIDFINKYFTTAKDN